MYVHLKVYKIYKPTLKDKIYKPTLNTVRPTLIIALRKTMVKGLTTKLASIQISVCIVVLFTGVYLYYIHVVVETLLETYTCMLNMCLGPAHP